MGVLKLFVCSQCNYEERVTGGNDRGFYVEVETNVCLDCQKLVNVAVKKLRENTYNADIELNKCPNCHGTNLEQWTLKEATCPKCGQEMYMF